MMQSPWFQYPSDYCWNNKTATIIGAGIAGHQIARQLAERGWQVTIIERHARYPQEASGNAAGIISPKITATPSLGESFYLQCFNYVIRQFARTSSLASCYQPCGVLKLACSENALARWDKTRTRKLPRTLVQCVTAEEASTLAGIPIHHAALFHPEAGWVDPQLFCKGLGEHSAIRYILSSEAIHLKYQNTQWEVRNQQKQVISKSEAVIICSGHNLKFTPLQHLPTMPVSGQTTLVGSESLGAKLQTVIDHDGYITPRAIAAGRYHLIGASYLQNSTHKRHSAEHDHQNLQKQQRCLPELAAELRIAERRGHTAVRMTTPDRLPYVGAVPNPAHYARDYADLHHGRHWKQYPQADYYPGLFIAGAFGSHGMTTAALCAEVLACVMNNKPSPFTDTIMHALHPGRFWIRQLKRRDRLKL